MSRGWAVSPAEEQTEVAAARRDIPLQELRLRRLRTPWEIAEIAQLRGRIALPARALADPGFALLEKKGMRKALSPASS